MRWMRPGPHFACDACGAEFLTAELLQEHRRNVHSRAAEGDRCGVCGERLASPAALREHLAREHGADVAEVVPCGECGALFAGAAALEEHMDQEHAQRAGMGPK